MSVFEVQRTAFYACNLSEVAVSRIYINEKNREKKEAMDEVFYTKIFCDSVRSLTSVADKNDVMEVYITSEKQNINLCWWH